MDLKETYDRIAEDWNVDHLNDVWWIEETDRFISLLGPGASILDVGCGSGLKSRILVQRGFKVTGIDLSEKMIEIARREVPGAKFLVQDIYDLSGVQGKFDAVFAQAVLLHIQKDKIGRVMSGLVSKLEKGGILYVAVKEKGPGKSDEQIERENDYGYEYERFFSYYEMPEMEKLFKDSGLQVLDKVVTSSGKTNWLQLIGKL